VRVDSLVKLCEEHCARFGLRVEVRPTDAEHEMITRWHGAATKRVPVLLNTGAWSHYSYAIRDACAMLRTTLIEVHISSIHAREFRHHLVVCAVATWVRSPGLDGSRLALEYIAAARPVV
jgi:3-dehydroquinate dehydratase-2